MVGLFVRCVFFFVFITVTGSFADLQVDVIRWDLTKAAGTLLKIDDDVLHISIEDGERATFPLKSVACVLIKPTTVRSNDESGTPDSNGMLHLVDGGRFTGRPEFDLGPFTWQNWWTGSTTKTLEEIRSFSMNDSSDSTRSPDVFDLVSLSNGDRLSGFIDSIESGLITLEKEDGVILTIPLKNVSQAHFANSLIPEQGPTLWSTRGDRFPVDSLTYDSDSGFKISDRPMSSDLVGGFVFESDGISALSSIPITLHEIGDTPRFHLPNPEISTNLTPLDTASIKLHGPVRAEWRLNGSGIGFVCTLVIPPASRRHADMEVRILDGNELLMSFEMNASNPTTNVSVRLSGDVLALEVLDSGGGPIMDRIELHEAILFSPRQ